MLQIFAVQKFIDQWTAFFALSIVPKSNALMFTKFMQAKFGMNHPAASSGVSQSSFPRRRESRHEELDTRFRGYDKRSKLRGI